MPKVDFGSRAQCEAELAAQEREAAEKAARALQGPDLSNELCCECGQFGPWGDGTFFYCAEHVPHDLQFAAAAFEKRKAEADGRSQ